MDVSENSGTPKWMVYNGKPYENGWFGGTTIFGNTHIVPYNSMTMWFFGGEMLKIYCYTGTMQQYFDFEEFPPNKYWRYTHFPPNHDYGRKGKLSIIGGSNLMQKYVDFEEFPLKIVHCLGW